MLEDYTIRASDIGKDITFDCSRDDLKVSLPMMPEGSTVTIKKKGHHELVISSPAQEQWNLEM